MTSPGFSRFIPLQALEINIKDHRNGKTSWYRIIDYLRKLTNQKDTSNTQTNIDNFKLAMKIMFEVGWEADGLLKERSKLDFYFSIKKNFGFESYLDSIELGSRVHMTKLRLSAHCLPVEILRYSKQYPNREDRTCNICEMNVLGDENHYLLDCTNRRMADARSSFLGCIKSLCPQLSGFDNKNIIKYCFSMKDKTTVEPTAKFAKEIYETYRKEEKLPPLKIMCLKKIGMLRR